MKRRKGGARALGLGLVLLLAGAAPAAARSFLQCSKEEARIADAALDAAMGLAVRAAAAMGDTPEYRRWFGAFDAARAERVRRNLKAIHRELLGNRLTGICGGLKDATCSEAFAYVTWTPGVINLCPSFFGMPVMTSPEGEASETGTREGTIIHELSHFAHLGATGDDCWSRPHCEILARRKPSVAVATADSYQYFAEDVSRTQVAGPE